jgi:hypothetical protein
MVNRKFLWQSFTYPAFSVTRKTCIAASKTIIRAQEQTAMDDGPELWIYHAFSVAAAVRSILYSYSLSFSLSLSLSSFASFLIPFCFYYTGFVLTQLHE